MGPGIPLKLPGICLCPHLLTLLVCPFSSETDLDSTRPPCSAQHQTRGRERPSPTGPGKGLGKAGVGSGWCHVGLCVPDGGWGVPGRFRVARLRSWPSTGREAGPGRHTEDCGIPRFSRGNSAKEKLPPARRSPCYNRRALSETSCTEFSRNVGTPRSVGPTERWSTHRSSRKACPRAADGRSRKRATFQAR